MPPESLLIDRFEALLAPVGPLTAPERRIWDALAAARETLRGEAVMLARSPEGRAALACIVKFLEAFRADALPAAQAEPLPVQLNWRQAGDWFVAPASRREKPRFLRPDLQGTLASAWAAWVRAGLPLEAARCAEALDTIARSAPVAEGAIALLGCFEQDRLAPLQAPRRVREVYYGITLDRVPERLWPAIWHSPAQQADWRDRLGLTPPAASDETAGLAWMRAHPSLTLETRWFDDDFTDRLLSAVDDMSLDGLLIHGDNLAALRLIRPGFAGGFSCVYLDPPYNKGNDSFVYADQLGSDAWLTMLAPRLELARSLMRPDGALFLSIDDGEAAHLRLLTERLFGREQFVANVIWQKKYTRANDARHFSDNHDHLLVFARERARLRLLLQPREARQLKAYTNPDGHPKGPWKPTPLHAKSGKDQGFSYTFANGVQWSPPPGTYPRFSAETLLRLEADGAIWFGADGRATPARKTFLAEAKPGVTPLTIWPHEEVGHTHEANNELKRLFPSNPFNNPKPLRLIDRVLSLAAPPAGWVLDFFAGSGTTAHAVIARNRADGGKRRYVVVEAGAHFETVLALRVRKAILAADWRDGMPTAPGGPGHTFKVMRLASDHEAWEEAASPQRRQEPSRADEERFNCLIGLSVRRIWRAGPYRCYWGVGPDGDATGVAWLVEPAAAEPLGIDFPEFARLYVGPGVRLGALADDPRVVPVA